MNEKTNEDANPGCGSPREGDTVRIPHGPSGTIDVPVVKTDIGFADRRKIRVRHEGVEWEIDEDEAEVIGRPES